MDKREVIGEFLGKLGEVSGKGFTIICNACQSNNVEMYDGVKGGSEYTGMWGDAGLKCLSCGNAEEIISF